MRAHRRRAAPQIRIARLTQRVAEYRANLLFGENRRARRTLARARIPKILEILLNILEILLSLARMLSSVRNPFFGNCRQSRFFVNRLRDSLPCRLICQTERLAAPCQLRLFLQSVTLQQL